MRLQKYIALSGVASRRKAEEMIQQGRVKLNGTIVRDMGVIINPTEDQVIIDNQPIKPEEQKIYILLHKPEGYVTTLSDEFNRPKVIDLLSDVAERVFPVGRLDYDTSGLLIMTNDGDLTYQLTHPKHEVKKTYIARVKGAPDEKALGFLKRGVDIGGYITAPAQVEKLKSDGRTSSIRIIIHEGKNRQIRKMLDAVGYPVLHLKRIAMGRIELGTLVKGKWRHLTAEEVRYLKSI
ncbi:pseudouridine synthase [Geosporobacter ferrireducens]|uniref:Pseudouridine synthase n=1 Tax=Geosporobacter ferrireducens TaxID=1424294 RepID=A0A1D8GB29_9FIRM|nr:pseudouridine synthase [Geosporobacter ferrireducens]AOT68119.1 pseudouridine synthase [Geosporobacter ferrireducens]MTI54165.1 rRNA pseudouridine synthase [Geosporobacter ferrireducens]